MALGSDCFLLDRVAEIGGALGIFLALIAAGVLIGGGGGTGVVWALANEGIATTKANGKSAVVIFMAEKQPRDRNSY